MGNARAPGAAARIESSRSTSDKSRRRTFVMFASALRGRRRSSAVGGFAQPPRKQQRLDTPALTPPGPGGDGSRTETTVLWTERNDRGARARAQRVERARGAPARSARGRSSKRNVSWRTLLNEARDKVDHPIHQSRVRGKILFPRGISRKKMHSWMSSQKSCFSRVGLSTQETRVPMDESSIRKDIDRTGCVFVEEIKYF